MSENVEISPSLGDASNPAPPSFGLADSAVKRIKELIERQKTPEGGLRIAVRGGGCSGLSYAMEWAEKPREKDRVFEREGARVFVDSKSFLYVKNSELIFEQGLMSTGFKIHNPNVKASCGCGESFAV